MKKLVFCLTLCGFILAGCKKVEPEGDRQIVVFLTSQSVLSSLKSTTPATSTEGVINKVVLFGFENSGAFVTGSKWVITGTPDPLGEELTVSRKVKTIWAIANPTQSMEEAEPANVTALKATTVDFLTAPASPFLMSGKGTVETFSATIKLYFTVAKVQIESSDTDFRITSITVQNTPNQGFVFDEDLFDAPPPPAVPVIPGGASRINYAQVNHPALPAPPEPMIFYVAENIAGNSTKFLVKGTLEGTPITDYSLELKLGSAIPILRNTYYKVSIGPQGEGVGTIGLVIPEWGDEDTDDHEFEEEQP